MKDQNFPRSGRESIIFQELFTVFTESFTERNTLDHWPNSRCSSTNGNIYLQNRFNANEWNHTHFIPHCRMAYRTAAATRRENVQPRGKNHFLLISTPNYFKKRIRLKGRGKYNCFWVGIIPSNCASTGGITQKFIPFSLSVVWPSDLTFTVTLTSPIWHKIFELTMTFSFGLFAHPCWSIQSILTPVRGPWDLPGAVVECRRFAARWAGGDVLDQVQFQGGQPQPTAS